jgi:hypothetical protein
MAFPGDESNHGDATLTLFAIQDSGDSAESRLGALDCISAASANQPSQLHCAHRSVALGKMTSISRYTARRGLCRLASDSDPRPAFLHALDRVAHVLANSRICRDRTGKDEICNSTWIISRVQSANSKRNCSLLLSHRIWGGLDLHRPSCA